MSGTGKNTVEAVEKKAFELEATVDIKDNVPYQPINYPLCPMCKDGSYPRCMSLSDYKYCMRVGGVC